MQNVSNTYESILDSANHWFQFRLTIDGAGTFEEDEIFSISTNLDMFSGTPEIGKAVSGEIDVRMLLPSVDIPPMATLRPYVRACNATSQSEWLPQGVFFIDTRERSKNYNGIDSLTIHGYDAMLKAETPFQSNTITGNSTDTAMVAEIASIMGVTVDSRTYDVMTNAYTVPLPVGYTCREVLGYIASMYVGSFLMTDEGKLRLVSMLELPPETNYLVTEGGDAITFAGVRILL